MRNSKKPLAVLSMAAVAGLLATAVTTPVSAKATAIAVNGTDSKVYSYDYAALKTSAVAYLTNDTNGAKLYNDFLTRKSSIKAYYDDVQKAYVDFSVVSAAATSAIINHTTFDFNAFLQTATTEALTPNTVATDANGNVVVNGQSTTVSSVSAINLTTGVGVVPTLPTTVNVTLGDGTTKAANITWNAAATSAATYATAGTVTVNGTLADYNNYPVSATVTVGGALSVQSVSGITATTTAGTVASLPTTVNVILSDGTTANAAITWSSTATAAATYANAGTVTVNGTLAAYNNYAVTGTVTVNPSANLAVSATAINPNEIKVVFNQPVDISTAQNVANYTITKAGVPYAATGTLTATLLADNKTVIINDLTATVENQMFANGATYEVTVANVLNTNYQSITKYDTGTLVFSDTTAPSLINAKYDGANIVLYFSEPVNATSISYKVDNGALYPVLTLASTTEVNSKGQYEVVIPAAAAEKTVGNHSITVYSVNDKASTPNVLAVATIPYTVAADTTAPSVTGVTAYTQNQFKVKVSEPLSVAPGSFATLLTVKNGSYTFPNADLASALDPTDSTGTTYIVTITPDDLVNNPLYATGVSSAALNVKVSGYVDNAGLVGADYNTIVTLSKSSVGPTLANAALNSGSGSIITLQFSAPISATTDYTKVTVLKNGVSIPVVSATKTGANNDQLAVSIAPTTLAAGNYTIQLAPGAVQDLYNVKNASTLNTTYTDTVAATTFIPTSVTNIGTNTIEILYPVAMDASAAVLANYTLDGNAFPTGTNISFYQDKQHVHITLPASYFASNTSGIVGITKNVKDTNGNYIVVVNSGVETQYTTPAPISFTDNVKPTLASAQYLLTNSTDTTTNTIKLTFSEALAVGAIGDTDDFNVLVNGVKQTVTAVNDGTTTGDKYISLTLANSVNVSQAATISIVPVASQADATLTITDVAGNKAVEGSSTTANTTTTIALP